jgi:hypothetical protein
VPAKGGGAVGDLVRDAVVRLDRFDLVGLCRDVAPEAMQSIPQLHGATSCDDPRLTGLMTGCRGCQRSDVLLSITVTTTGDRAVAHIRVTNAVGSSQVVEKDVRAVRVHGEWKLLDSPAATVP